MTEAVELELRRLHDQHGGLFPEKVVDAARVDTSPLHEHFTWDDSEAAHQHRLNEARFLIREVKIVVHHEPDRVVKVRGFVSVIHEGERRYMKTERALVEHADQVLEDLRRDIEQLRRKYANLKDFNAAMRQLLEDAERGEAA